MRKYVLKYIMCLGILKLLKKGIRLGGCLVNLESLLLEQHGSNADREKILY